MKKYLIAIAMVLTLSMNANAAAQKHRHTPRTEQVDSTKKDQPAIEAYSDTANARSAEDAEDDKYITHRHVYADDDFPGSYFSGMGRDEIFGMGFVVLIVLLTCVVAPIGIIIAIFYFVNKNRRERYRLAQMAMQNGQPIPDDILKKEKDDWDSNTYQAGLRQMFTGVGLAIFLGIIMGKLGFGIGALVFFIGLGKWIVARQDKKGDPRNSQFYNNLNTRDNEQKTDAL